MAAITLRAVGPEDGPVLSNLMELYSHELSDVFALKIGSDGRYGYPGLAQFWLQPETRFAYIIAADDEIAGFALATRGSPASDDPSHMDVAEFFVLRAHRKMGVGKRAAGLLWERHPGHWIVRVATKNASAITFWRRTIDAYTSGRHSERTLELKGVTRQVFAFDSQPSDVA